MEFMDISYLYETETLGGAATLHDLHNCFFDRPTYQSTYLPTYLEAQKCIDVVEKSGLRTEPKLTVTTSDDTIA